MINSAQVKKFKVVETVLSCRFLFICFFNVIIPFYKIGSIFKLNLHQFH